MTGTDERAQGRAHDPDSTVVMPNPFSAGHDATVVLPTVPVERDAASSVGYDVSPAEATATTSVDDAGASVAHHGAIMAVGSIVSRVTGFLRTAAIGAAIGVLAVGDDYILANTLPGMVHALPPCG